MSDYIQASWIMQHVFLYNEEIVSGCLHKIERELHSKVLFLCQYILREWMERFVVWLSVLGSSSSGGGVNSQCWEEEGGEKGPEWQCCCCHQNTTLSHSTQNTFMFSQIFI